MVAFRTSEISFPPTTLKPGSCQAVRIAAILEKPIVRVPVTPEWLEMNEAKQRAYAIKRAAWRKEVGLVDTN